MALEFAKLMNLAGRRDVSALAGELPARDASAGNPRSAIEMNVSQVALMWILHQRALSTRKPNEPLHQQISEFSAPVFKAILSDSPSIKREHLWMIYFKGLIVSNTHPRETMVQAIHLVQAQNVATWRASVAGHATDATGDHAPPEAVSQPEAPAHADSEALQQITTALGHATSNASGH